MSAGIGGNKCFDADAGNIIIGGNVTVEAEVTKSDSGELGTGIGGSANCSGGIITMSYNANVTASGGENGVGISEGYDGSS